MYINIKLNIVICICKFIAASNTSLKTKSVIYGEDTYLTCNGYTCSPYSAKQWIGGPSYDLLCSEDYLANSYKYEMVVQSTSFYFDLMIKNFTFNDANCQYTCVCGLQQYTKMLELDSLEFIYPPYLERDFQVANESQLQIELLMKVYPLPKCKISHQENIIPVNYTDYTTTYYHDGHFKLYTVRIQHLYAMDHLSCKGSLNLICTVGSRNYTLIEKTITLCSKDQNDLTDIGIVVACLVLLCVLVVTCIVLCTRIYVKSKAKNIKHEHSGMKEDKISIVSKNSRDSWNILEHES